MHDTAHVEPSSLEELTVSFLFQVHGDVASLLNAFVELEAHICFCGIYLTPARSERFDNGIRYLTSGLSMIVRSDQVDITQDEVLVTAFGKPQPMALFAVVMLFTLAMIYGRHHFCSFSICVCIFFGMYELISHTTG